MQCYGQLQTFQSGLIRKRPRNISKFDGGEKFMAFSDVCKIYRQGEKFLVLNPSVPSWLVTSVNGVLLLKLYSAEKSFEDIAEEFRLHAPDFPASSVLKFLEHAERERLFKEPTKLAELPT